MAQTADIIIVGGGIMGTSLAYYLCREGVHDVTLIEKRNLAGGSTCKSAAIVRMHYTNPATVAMALRSRELFLIVDQQCAWVDTELFGLRRFETGQTFMSSYGGNRA